MTFLTMMLSVVIALNQGTVSQRMSDREHAGFIGPVKKVFVEWSPVDRPYNDIAPGTRCRDSTHVYDRDGRLTQDSLYPGECGGDEIREYYSYGRDGSQTSRTEQIRGKDSPPPPPPIATFKKTEPGTPSTVFKYDSAGRLAEASTLRPSGKLIYKSAYTYDEKSRLMEFRSYDEDDKVSSRRVYTYEGTKAVPSTFAYFDDRGKVHEEITYSDYEFNSRGDWVKRKETRQERVYVSGQTFIRKSISSSYRQIEYY
jgi:hypothetical protein